MGDLLLFGLTVLGIKLLPPGRRTRWYLLAAAGLVNATGDISALFGGIIATDVGWFLDAMAWPTSLLLISCAVWLAPDPGVPVQERSGTDALRSVNDRVVTPAWNRVTGIESRVQVMSAIRWPSS